jgi:hypothetical protein
MIFPLLLENHQCSSIFLLNQHACAIFWDGITPENYWFIVEKKLLLMVGSCHCPIPMVFSGHSPPISSQVNHTLAAFQDSGHGSLRENVEKFHNPP